MAPVYAQGASGLGALAGPAGGYLVGFVVAAVRRRGARRTLAADGPSGRCSGIALVGLVPIYAIGASWLAWQLHATAFEAVVWGGVVQFIPGDVVKAVAAAFTARALVSLPLGLPALAASPLRSASASPRRRRLMRPRSYSSMKSVALPSR